MHKLPWSYKKPSILSNSDPSSGGPWRTLRETQARKGITPVLTRCLSSLMTVTQLLSGRSIDLDHVFSSLYSISHDIRRTEKLELAFGILARLSMYRHMEIG